MPIINKDFLAASVPTPAAGNTTFFTDSGGAFIKTPAGTVTGLGGVVSIGISGANGIGVSGSPVTSSGVIALSLSAITPTTIVASSTIQGTTITATTGFSGVGSSITALTATNISSGTVPTARLGSGTANATTFLRGDQTWQLVTDTIAPTMVAVAGTTQAATAGNEYVLNNVATTTVTLPAAPATGDIVWVTVNNGLFTNVIARNGLTIMGSATDMTVNWNYANVQLRYNGTTWLMLN